MLDGSATDAVLRRAVIAYDRAAIAAVLRIAAGLRPAVGMMVISAPGGAAWPGPRVFRAMVEAAAAEAGMVPEAVLRHAVLDCADLSGAALGALRAGWQRLVLWPEAAGFAAVAAAAREAGAEVLHRAPPALDLGPIDLRRPGGQQLVARWLQHGERPGGGD